MVRGALPVVAVAVIGGGTGLVGVLNALGLAAFLLLGVRIGRVIDRVGAPERAMALSSVVRGACGLAVALMAWGGVLHGAIGAAALIVYAAVVGVADVFYSSGQGVLVARRLPREELRRGFGRIQTWALTGDGLGRLALAAVLAWGSTRWVWVAAAALYFLSCLSLGGGLIAWARKGRGARAERQRESGTRRPVGALEGGPDVGRGAFHALLASAPLRRVTVSNAVANAAAMAANTVLPVMALSVLAVPPQWYVGVGVLGALGGVLGAAVGSALVAR
jgi:hypothetical protein